MTNSGRTAASSSHHGRALMNTKQLATATAVAVGASAGLAAPALGAIYVYTTQAGDSLVHITYPSYDTTAGMNKLGDYTKYFSGQSAVAKVSSIGFNGAVHGGRPQIFRSGSGGSFYSTEAVSGKSLIRSGPYGTVHKKMLGCGPVSTNAYLGCVAGYQ